MLYRLLIGCGIAVLLAAAWVLVQHFARKAGCATRVGGCCGNKECHDDRP